MSSISNHNHNGLQTNVNNRERSMTIKARKTAEAIKNIPTMPTVPPTMYHSGVTAADLAKFERMKEYQRPLNKTEQKLFNRLLRLKQGCTLKPLPAVAIPSFAKATIDQIARELSEYTYINVEPKHNSSSRKTRRM